MTRMIAAVCLTAALATSAWADRLELVDGRTFEGTVIVDAETVTVKMTYGTLQFSPRDVSRITYMDTPAETLAKKVEAVAAGDADGLFVVAKWAIDNGLDTQAKELLTKIIALDDDHAEARRRLLYTRIDGKWHTHDSALELVRSKLQAGRHEDLLANVLPAVARLPLSSAQRSVVDDLRARAQLQAGRFADARAAFGSLADRVGGDVGIQYAAIAGILGEYKDGMYVLKEVYPPQAALVRPEGQVAEKGPGSLARPIVLEAALWEVARTTELEAGRELLAEARKIEPTDPDAARTKYALATRRFLRADAIVAGTRTPGVAKAYHIEVARCRIRAIRAVVEADAKKYEQIKATLGRNGMSDKEYRALILRMMQHLSDVRSGLKEVIALAKPYPRALVLEVSWAEVDLKKIEEVRAVLVAELDNGK